MKKIMFISFIGVSMLLVFIGLNRKSNYVREDNILGIYLDNKLQEDIPKKGEAVFSKAVCDNSATNFYWDIDKWGLFISNLSKKTKCNLYFVNYSGQTIFDFDYTGGEQTFTAPVSGTYRLEVWGAQGGNIWSTMNGYGGYSVGNINLNSNSSLYIAIGGKGQNGNDYYKSEAFIGLGGWNGGGNGGQGALNLNSDYYMSSGAGGGGATSIQNELISDGQLQNYSKNVSNIIIVSGGGGGYGGNSSPAGNGGGFAGKSTMAITASDGTNYGGKSSGGTQYTGYKFGIGQSAPAKDNYAAYGAEGNGGGGGGFYGGLTNSTQGFGSNDSGAGGSGYIGNHLLTNKVMYCYDCEESNEESTKTISTTCSEEIPTSYCAKKGNGYARITLVSID